jgi:hypothetical protein
VSEEHVMAWPSALSLDQAATLIGGHRWVEHHLFELSGRWSALAPWNEVQLHLFEKSLQHGWHAELFAARLPVLAHIDPLDLSVAPPAASRVWARLEELDEPLQVLAGLYRVVLPRTLAHYEHHRSATTVATDGPTMRALDLVIRDEMSEWREGESLLQSVLSDEKQVCAAAELVAELEGLIVESAPGLGWDWPKGAFSPKESD